MRTKENESEKNDIEKLTEEIKNLKLELKTSNEFIKALLKTVKTLRGNRACEHTPIKCSSTNKGKKTEARATF